MRKCLQCDHSHNTNDAAACIVCGSALPRVLVIELRAKDKLGVKLKPPTNGVIEHGVSIDGVDNKLLEGKVMIGDLIIAIGGTAVDQMSFSAALDLIRTMPRPLAIVFEIDEKRRYQVRAEKRRYEQSDEYLAHELASYAVVFDEGPMGLNLEEAVRYGIDGAVVKTLNGQAKTKGRITIGDIVYKVNDMEVLCMPYAEVMELIRSTPSPKTIQFVPKDKLADVQRVNSRHSESYRLSPSTPSAKKDISSGDKSIAQLNTDNQNATSVQPPADGFLASRDTYSSSSVWTDPSWLALLATGQSLTVRIGSLVAQHEHTEVWRSACGQFALKGLRGNPAMTNVAAFVARMSSLSTLSARLVAKPLAALGSSALTLRVVTAFAERGDLRSLLLAASGDNNSGMSWEEDKSVIALDVAEALEYLHSPNMMKAVVVGDLHASHVLVNGDGHARVNVVSFSTASSANIKSGGFPYWSAPEVLQGGVATTASDVYAFGVLLCELDTGVPPFSSDGRSLPELHAGVMSGELRSSVSDSCPPRIEQLAVECMAGDPTFRPSAAQVVYRLRDIIKNDL